MRTISLLVVSLGLAAGALALSTPSRQLQDPLTYEDW